MGSRVGRTTFGPPEPILSSEATHTETISQNPVELSAEQIKAPSISPSILHTIVAIPQGFHLPDCTRWNRQKGRCRWEYLVAGYLFAHSVLSDSVTPWTLALVPPSMGFPRQEYWSGLPFPSPGDLLDPGIELASPGSPVLQADSWPLHHLGSWIPRTSSREADANPPSPSTGSLGGPGQLLG